MNRAAGDPLADLRARSLIAWSVAGMGTVMIGGEAVGTHWIPDPIFEEVVLWVAMYLPPLLWVRHKLRQRGLTIGALIGHLPQPRRWLAWTAPVPFLIATSIGCFWLVYYPLSFAAPDYVTALLDTQEDHLFAVGPTASPAALAILGLLGMVVVAPVVEEIVFRGVLLHRWQAKWGTGRAVAASSVLFGLLHIDVLGSIFFGVVMAALYVHTRTLLVPMACHALNNLVAWTLTGATGETGTTLAEFRSLWWVGAACLVLAVPWAVWYGDHAFRHWQLPRPPGPATS